MFVEGRTVAVIRPYPSAPCLENRVIQLQASGSAIDKLGAGIEGRVSRVTVQIGTREPKGFAYKQYYSELGVIYALKSWIALNGAGIPVPPTFRIVEDADRLTGVLMTDLTQGWKNILISSNDTKYHVLENVLALHPQTVEMFRKIDLHDPLYQDSMYQKLCHIAHNAAKHGIRFGAKDVVSAVFTQNGDMVPVISDMGNIVVDSCEPTGALFMNNFKNANAIIDFIADAQVIAKRI